MSPICIGYEELMVIVITFVIDVMEDTGAIIDQSDKYREIEGVDRFRALAKPGRNRVADA